MFIKAIKRAYDRVNLDSNIPEEEVKMTVSIFLKKVSLKQNLMPSMRVIIHLKNMSAKT